MSEPDPVSAAETSADEENRPPALFLPEFSWYNQPARIVTLGHFYPQGQIEETKTQLKELRGTYRTDAADPTAMRRNLGWTRLINALNQERQWPIKRLFALLDPMLETDIALAVVPTHLGHQAFWPLRTLARQLAETTGRTDATSCLVRHATIRRITYGGPSTPALHRQTIHVENAHLVQGRRVLLLDDIAKSGTSLVTCRKLLYEAGASLVQAMALGRVIIPARSSK